MTYDKGLNRSIPCIYYGTPTIKIQYTARSLCERIFYIHKNLYLVSHKQSVIETFTPIGEFVVRGYTETNIQPLYNAQMCKAHY